MFTPYDSEQRINDDIKSISLYLLIIFFVEKSDGIALVFGR